MPIEHPSTVVDLQPEGIQSYIFASILVTNFQWDNLRLKYGEEVLHIMSDKGLFV
jgi:hypothetical protein